MTEPVKNTLDIEAMIREENDPNARAMLVVLNSINNNLTANTQMTQKVSERLDEHTTEYKAHVKEFANHANSEEAIINKGIGAWRVLSVVLGLAQLILIASVGFVSADLKDIHAAILTGVVADEKINTRLSVLEARK